MPKTIAILNATGSQGSGLIHALLNPTNNTSAPENNEDFTIRALTRNTTSPAAQALRAKYPDPTRLSLVTADVYDVQTLRDVFKGVDGLFAATNNRLPAGKLIEREEDMRHELVAGRNIVDAARECNIPHVILSSLPNINRASNGRFQKVYHFDHKAQIEEWAREELKAVTVLLPGLFWSNMQWPQYCREMEDGTVRFCAPVSGHQRADWVDPAYDIGLYAAEILKQGPTKTASRTYPVTSPKLPFADLPRIFTRVTGRRAIFEPISLDEWGATVTAAAGKGYESDIRQMMEWIAIAPDERVCYGTLDSREGERVRGELGVRASTFEEWLGRSGWRGP